MKFSDERLEEFVSKGWKLRNQEKKETISENRPRRCKTVQKSDTTYMHRLDGVGGKVKPIRELFLAYVFLFLASFFLC